MKKLNIKLIGIDLDHTLISFGKKNISSFDFDAIQKTKLQNINVFIFTGRSVDRSLHYSEMLGLKYHVSFGGSLIYSLNPKKVIKYYSFSKDEVFEMKKQKIFENKNLFSTFYVLDLKTNKVKSFYYGIKNEAFSFHQIDLDVFEKINDLKELLKWPLIRINVFANLENLKKTEKALQKTCKSNAIFNYQTVLETTPFGVNKGVAMEFLQKKLNISPENTMAIGDSANDISMFKKVKYGIAVANADQRLKKFAFEETDSYDASGVGKALQKLVIE